MKLLVIGQGRHGKDTFCEILQEKYKVTFSNSSYAAAKIFIFDTLKDRNGYKTVEECFNDRHTGNNRQLWYDLITDYNKDDPARLAKDILKENSIYCGMRSKRELDECRRQKLFDAIIWVDAYQRLGQTEDESSITVTKEDADFVVYNNDSEDEFKRSVLNIYEYLDHNQMMLDNIQYL